MTNATLSFLIEAMTPSGDEISPKKTHVVKTTDDYRISYCDFVGRRCLFFSLEFLTSQSSLQDLNRYLFYKSLFEGEIKSMSN